VIRPALIIVLLASSTKLLGASNQLAAIAVGAAVVLIVAVNIGLSAQRKASAQKSPVSGADAAAG
jgi:hypothetical protein